MEKDVYLIVGLGNPGAEYAHTRHNVGFEVMERLLERYRVTLKERRLLQGAVAEVATGEKKLVLCEPLTFMNKGS